MNLEWAIQEEHPGSAGVPWPGWPCANKNAQRKCCCGLRTRALALRQIRAALACVKTGSITRMRRFELVIFDCDGVLVDSELITNRVFAGVLGELGLPVTLEFVFEHFVGRSMQHCWEEVAGMLGKEVPAHWQSEFQLRTTAALEAEVQAVHGIEAVLDALEVPYCVASSGSHAKMATTLGATGLLPRFSGRIFSAADVARGKPAPDIFLHAASRSGVQPRD